MGWSKLKTNTELNSLISFLMKREWECVFFTSFISENFNNIFGKKNHNIFIKKDSFSSITGAVLIQRNGSIIPVFDSPNPENEDLDLFSRIIIENSKDYYSLIGTNRNISPVKKILNQKNRGVNYYIMEYKKNTTNNSKKNVNLIIKKAGISDAKTLFPLQAEYEKEEVLFDPAKFNSFISYASLKKSLKTRINYYAELNGKAVARAGTNASGFDYFQIGSVYTHKKYRGMGIAGHLLKTLIDDISGKKKKVCLFVKKNNPPALRLYKKSGFVVKDDFSIIYYR